VHRKPPGQRITVTEQASGLLLCVLAAVVALGWPRQRPAVDRCQPDFLRSVSFLTSSCDPCGYLFPSSWLFAPPHPCTNPHQSSGTM
jgi:hypothetical protein